MEGWDLANGFLVCPKKRGEKEEKTEWLKFKEIKRTMKLYKWHWIEMETIQIFFIIKVILSKVFHRNSLILGVKYVYKRYASLFFCIGVDEDENELLALALIHRIVEGVFFQLAWRLKFVFLALDRYFGNVCELDVIFNFERVHAVLDEILLGGEIQVRPLLKLYGLINSRKRRFER